MTYEVILFIIIIIYMHIIFYKCAQTVLCLSLC